MSDADLEDRLLFLIGAPRSGSTLLARMLGAHSAIHAPAEPHLLTPLAHLGYFAKVERADYDPLITHGAIRALVADLPGGESDYIAALRAYCDALYTGLLENTGREWLLDKTPAYVLVLDFVAKLYPKARFIVLTRHPFAIWSSYVSSFFDGDHEIAHAHTPLLERYVPAIARFLREAPVAIQRVHYEKLVQDPASQMEALCRFIGVGFEPAMIDYGADANAATPAARGLGDPVTVARETRPTIGSLARWMEDWSGDPGKLDQAERILASLLDEDLETWGFSRGQISQELARIDRSSAPRGRSYRTRHALERKLLVRLRRNIHRNALGRLVRRIRFACDVLLR